MGHGDSCEVTFLSQTRKSRWQRERPPPQHLQMEIYGSLTETLQRAGWKCFVTDWSRPQPPQTDQRRCYVSIHHSGQQAITQGSWKNAEKSWSVIDQMHHPLRHPDTVWKAGWHTYYSRLLKVLQKDWRSRYHASLPIALPNIWRGQLRHKQHGFAKRSKTL